METTVNEQDLAARLTVVEARVARLEARVLPLPPLPAPPARTAAAAPLPPPQVGTAAPALPLPPSPPPARSAAAAPPPPASPWPGVQALEDLLGGRVLAWAGGSAVVLAILFLLALAVQRGWFGPAARLLVAATVSAGLVGLGTWLQERRDRTQAALWATGAGVTGLLLTLLAATPGYGLLPVVVTLPAAGAVGALSVALGLRWSARALVWLGVSAAVGAPASLAGSAAPLPAPLAMSLTYLVVVAAAAAALCVLRGWHGLLLASLLLTWAQMALWTATGPTVVAVLVVLPAVGALSLAAAVTALRRGSEPAEATTPLLLAAMSVWWLAETGSAALPAAAEAWWLVLVALVALGVGAGLAADGVVRRTLAALLAQRAPLTTPVSGLLILLVGALGAVGADPGWPAVASLAWRSGAAVGLDLLARRARRDGGETTAVDALALTLLAAVTWGLVDGWLRLALLCLAALALRGVARVTGEREAEVGAAGLWGLGVVHVLLSSAPPQALLDGVAAPASAAAALVGLAAVAAASAWAQRRGRQAWTAAAVAALGYLASVLVVSVVLEAPSHWPLGAGTPQGAQVALGALWTVSGAVALWTGLRRGWLSWRIAGFVLFACAVVKAVLYDLAWLDLGYRAASYFALGLLLLAGAYAYQRRRPRDS